MDFKNYSYATYRNVEFGSNMLSNAILVIPLAFWIIERKSKRSKLVKDPSDYWEKRSIQMQYYRCAIKIPPCTEI